jgi:hypothetical protein
MFIPGAGFISAIVSIYDTIMVFVQKISKIIAVVKSFVDSIVDIANGAIDGAAKRVETTLAGLLSLAISFFAGFIGLGDVVKPVMDVIHKVQAVIDKAIDSLIDWIVKTAKSLFAKVFGKKDEPDTRTDAQKLADVDSAVSAAEGAMAKDGATPDSIQKDLAAIKSKYKLTSIELVKDTTDETSETDHVEVTINPGKKSNKQKITKVATSNYEVEWTRDDKGRAISAKATLKKVFSGAARSSAEVSAQGKAAALGKSDDVGGHIIGHRFVKDQGIINMFPQNVKFNNSAWKIMENEWAAAIRAGNHVIVNIGFSGKDPNRPDKISVAYEFVDVDGLSKHTFSKTFTNDAAQTMNRLSTEAIEAL